MAGYRATEIRVPANETEFEKNCVVLFSELIGDPTNTRVGTKGQRQHGLDVVGFRNRDPKKLVGIQCKLKTGRSKLTKTEAAREIKKALGYTPHITEYFIVTTSKDDINLQQFAQEQTQEQAAAGRTIHIHIWGWDTLQEKIDQSEAAKQAFDPGFSPSIASQDRKLNAILAHQQQQPTSKQLANIAKTLRRRGSEDIAKLPPAFAERELKERFAYALRRRGFAKTNTPQELGELALRAIEGDLTQGPPTIRAEICDRAARANADPKSLKLSKRFRKAATKLDPTRDLFIVDALLHEAAGDSDATLRALKSRMDVDTRSALLTTLVRQRGSAAALEWAKEEKLEPRDFNPPGAMNLILQEIDQGEFGSALDHVAKMPNGYADQCPAILLLRAQLTLAAILPTDQKAALFQGLPLNFKELQLASGVKAQESIRAAATDLRALISLLDELGLQYLEKFLKEFELWLRLEDDDTQDETRAQVAKEIADPELTLHRVRLALSYRIPFNQDALQRRLTWQKDVGGWTPDERFASFLLAYHSNDAKKISDFFDRHHDDLFSQTDLVRSALAGIEIQALAHTGRFEDARAHITLHTGPHLTQEDARNLEEIVASIEKGDEVERMRQRYEQSRQVTDLRVLVGSLRRRRDTKQLATYAPLLVRETKTIEDFDIAVKALFQNDRLSEVLTLIADYPQLIALNDECQSLEGWALFRLGHVMEARAIARRLMTKRNATNDRELVINTAIESGDWGNIQALLAQEASRTDAIPPNDLIRLARLALEVTSPYVDQFRDAALGKAPDDPQVHLSAYMLAIERGQEYRPGGQAHLWFQKAIVLSGPEGPVRSVSMNEMIDHASGWNERTEKIDTMLRRAEAPLFIVAKALRRQLLDLILGQALRNSDPSDSCIKYPVFAFYGAHPWQSVTKSAPLALDISSIITLEYLGLLQMVVEHFDNVLIAPSTLSMLFIDRQFLRVQQPSEVAKAERIRALISSGGLKAVPEDVEPSAVETKEIGRDLASLLALAKRTNGLVVRSAPVSKVGTYLEEDANMSGHAEVLTDTRSVLAFLSQGAKIDAGIKKVATDYLHQVDKGWDNSPAIMPDSKLYLDDLAVTYLDHVGLLETLIRSVSDVYIHPDVEIRARQTINYGKQTTELLAAIESIRGTLSAVLEEGKVKFSSRRLKDDDGDKDTESFGTSPSLDIMSNLDGIDAVITDDRCLNKLPTWSDGLGHSARAATTLEVLDELKAAKRLSDDAHLRARHKLRAAGYYAMPLREAEILHHLKAAPLDGKSIRETPELKSIRESVAVARINNAFLSAETPWLNGFRFEIIKGLRSLWTKSVAGDASEAQSDWMLSILPDPLEWCMEPENEAVWGAARRQAIAQTGFLLVFADGTVDQRRRYFTWLNDAYIKPFGQKRFELWSEVIPFLKSYMLRLLEADNET
jgi:hypothetical protein